jgi:quinol monooxygenase YgiN
VAEILEELIPLSRAEPGLLRYDVFRAADNAHTFLLVEEYEDTEALEAHVASAHVQRLLFGEALDLLDERVRTYLQPL